MTNKWTIPLKAMWFSWSISCKMKVSIWCFWVSVRARLTNRWMSLCFVCVWACVSAGMSCACRHFRPKRQQIRAEREVCECNGGEIDTSHQCDSTENWSGKHTNITSHDMELSSDWSLMNDSVKSDKCDYNNLLRWKSFLFSQFVFSLIIIFGIWVKSNISQYCKWINK